MTTVSKGQMRFYKLRTERLSRAVPTLDLRRKQLNREILVWEEDLYKIMGRYEELKRWMDENPHPEIDKLVEIENVETNMVNIAGVILEEVTKVTFKPARYSLFATPPSFDVFIRMMRDLVELSEKLNAKKRALDLLTEELAVTTQRINLFEKRLIPEYRQYIRYIKGRLEDNERASVMIAKIAQAEMLSEQHTFEAA